MSQHKFKKGDVVWVEFSTEMYLPLGQTAPRELEGEGPSRYVCIDGRAFSYHENRYYVKELDGTAVKYPLLESQMMAAEEHKLVMSTKGI